VSTLAGVVLGAGAAYFFQARQWKRTSRYDRYRSFAGRCDVAFECLLDVRHALEPRLPQPQVDAAWQRGNAEFRDVLRLFGEMEAGSTEKTLAAAETLRGHVSDLKKELFVQDHGKPGRRP